MTTILKKTEVRGNSLMKNQDCSVQILPSNTEQIRFFVKNSSTPIIANIESLKSTDHCVTLSNGKDKIMLIEHFMAACAFCNINSIDVYTSDYEMPILDGSSKSWVELFKKAGIEKHKKQAFKVSEPVYYLNGKTHLIIVPDEELNITYAINYDHPDLKGKWVSFNPTNENEIIEARTFGYLKDLKKYQLLGFAKGVTQENTVGMKDEGFTTELRSPLEPIKHKMLDLIGDLYLTGINPLEIKAQIIVKEAGHTVHAKVAKILKDKLIKI
jgi:UDP-3-O-acyl-N-acetylglucosamine deacetylase